MFGSRKTAGVTLIEVNLAMGVLLFGIVCVASLFPTGLTLAEKGFRASDAAIIASMAKSQLEMLSHADIFRFPRTGLSIKSWEGRMGESAPKDVPVEYEWRQFRYTSLEGSTSLDTGPEGTGLCPDHVWANCYLLITSGREAGRVFRIQNNKTQGGFSTLTLYNNVARTHLHKGDSFRIIKNVGGTQCIPAGFLLHGDRIPTINGVALDKVRKQLKNPEYSFADLSSMNAVALAAAKYCRYSYAILLDGPEKGSQSVFRAYVLVYKDFDPTLGNDWWKNPAPVEYYSFFYRKP